MSVCLVLGGAQSVWIDALRHLAKHGPADGVVACNDAGADWSGQLDAWVSLHPRNLWSKGWLERRAANGYPEAKRYFAHPEAVRMAKSKALPPEVEFTPYLFPGQEKSGSSGLFAAKVALIDLGFDRVVFCGVPMTRTPHFFDEKEWSPAVEFRRQWQSVAPEYLARMRSMSGWTAEFLGAPERDTFAGTSRPEPKDGHHETPPDQHNRVNH